MLEHLRKRHSFPSEDFGRLNISFSIVTYSTLTCPLNRRPMKLLTGYVYSYPPAILARVPFTLISSSGRFSANSSIDTFPIC